MIKQIIILLFFSSLFLMQQGFAQEGVVDDCITVQEIEIPFKGKKFVTNTSEKKSNSYNLVYYTDADEFTFWYKLIITKDCKLKFSVKPSHSGDDYDFMIFKFASTNFCEAIRDNLLAPLNENFYEEDQASTPSQNSTRKIIVANQKQMRVKKGETYYLSVLNIFGEDCGHRLTLDANGNSVTINSVHKPCFVFSQPESASEPEETAKATIPKEKEKTKGKGKKKSKKEVKKEEVADKEAQMILVEDSLYISGLARDNDTGKPIDAKISFSDVVTGKETHIDVTYGKGYKIELERGRKYNLTCSAFGYYDIKGVIEFLKPSVYDFYLLKIKEGENFIMENILFHPSTYALTEESYPELDKLALYMSRNEKLKIEVQGHTAGDNSVRQTKPEYAMLGEEWNYTGTAKKLSKLRAEAVKNYIVTKGEIRGYRVSTAGFGAEKRLIPNPKSREERMKNMRVEVKITDRGDKKNTRLGAERSEEGGIEKKEVEE